MVIFHYINLTNGLDCPHFPELESNPWTRVSRIQSTHCEGKHWNQLLITLGPEFYLMLATRSVIVVHDKSEKERETRAAWQGLSWIRAAVQLSWGDSGDWAELSRNGMDVTPYWKGQWAQIPKRTKDYLRYFRKFSIGGPVPLFSCYRWRASIIADIDYDLRGTRWHRYLPAVKGASERRILAGP